jgi:hypothetical protein
MESHGLFAGGHPQHSAGKAAESAEVSSVPQAQEITSTAPAEAESDGSRDAGGGVVRRTRAGQASRVRRAKPFMENVLDPS